MLINQQINPEDVNNPLDFLPSVSVDDMISLMRIDKTQGSERIAEYIAHAYDVVNGYLPSKMLDKSYPQSEHWRRTYCRAVLHEASALFVDDYPDYDSTGAGSIRADNEASKSDKLRRIVHHCVADITGKPRNRIALL